RPNQLPPAAAVLLAPPQCLATVASPSLFASVPLPLTRRGPLLSSLGLPPAKPRLVADDDAAVDAVVDVS
ncbi:hypothetical protein Tsubulata_017069, partial [Turnera subulata]